MEIVVLLCSVSSEYVCKTACFILIRERTNQHLINWQSADSVYITLYIHVSKWEQANLVQLAGYLALLQHI